MDTRMKLVAVVMAVVLALVVAPMGYAINEDNPGHKATGVSHGNPQPGQVTIHWDDGTTSVWDEGWFSG